MASFDLISSSFKAAWSAGGYTGLCPASALYYGRPQKPAQLAGFPYMGYTVTTISEEQRTKVQSLGSLVKYMLTVTAWTVQGMTGGTTSGDQVTDQGNLQRGLETVLNFIPPNLPWYNLMNFLHCLKIGLGEPTKDKELYLGKDVFFSDNSWEIMVAE